MKKVFFLMLALLIWSVASVNAQVTIGSTQDPPAYSILELDASTQKGGLHLPRLTTAERNALVLDVDAAGLLVFNTSTDCLDFWTGSAWKSQCESSLPESVSPFVPASLEENGRYTLYGKILFDVNDGAVSAYPEPYKNYPADYPHSCDLASNLTHTYTLKSADAGVYSFSSVQFVVNDPTKLLDSYAANNAAGTVDLTFNSLASVKTLVGTAGRTDAKKITITAFFLDNWGLRKKTELVVRVQNAPVGCSVRKVDDPTNATPAVDGWLTFMCYNLGADPDYGDPVAQKAYVPSPNTSSSTDRTVYGDLYQWGRVADGHQRRDLLLENVWPVDRTGSTSGFTADPVPDNEANINLTTGQVLETDVRFGKFIRRNSGTYDWIASTAAVHDTRWNSGTESAPVKTASDPCPSGWRVPTHTEWASIYGTTTDCTSSATCYTTAKVNQWVHNFAVPPAGEQGTHGVSLTPSAAQGNTTYTSIPATLFLPAGDDRNRDHATIDNNGTSSCYWSSTVAGINAYYLRFGNTHLLPSDPNFRSNGGSVRCVSE